MTTEIAEGPPPGEHADPPQSETPSAAPRARQVRVAAALVVAVVLLVLAQYAGRPLANRLGLVSRAEAYTALSFVRPAQVIGQHAGATVRLTFAVANHEGATRRYRWQVIDGRFPHRPLAAGALRLRSGATAERRVVLPGIVTFGVRTVLVRLLSPAESIDVHLGA